ncbi:MAG: hypothetical protein GXY41_07955 [Phycisphaerae bacterium]|nr:hypothetical protein [Phycisphaerae bacterium]
MQLRSDNVAAQLGGLFVQGLRGLEHLLFPPYCILCQTPICHSEDGLCAGCWQELSRNEAGDYCRRCGR